jgi:leader peptidase (prepilin peptidase) / N-methyltransferase
MLVVVGVLAAFLGAAIGSFAGVVALRGFRASLGGRSHCDACGRTLQWYELVPLVSFVALRGRCRSCGASIGWGAYGWEAAGAGVAVVVLLVVAATRS